MLLCTSTAATSTAQSSLRAQRSWINFGVGRSAYPTTHFNWGVNYHLQRERLYQVGFNVSGKPVGNESVASFHAALGTRLGRRFAQAAAFIGPAFVFGEEKIEHPTPVPDEVKWFYTGGVFADLQGLLLIPDIGLGIDIFSIVSLKNSTVGIRANFTYHR